MKIKADFITNSSSVAFIITSPVVITESDIDAHPPYALEELITFDNPKDLIEYTQDGSYDWINEVMGPRQFWGMSDDRYEVCRKIIDEGNIAIHIDMSRNYWDEIEKLERIVRQKGGKILIQESD